jgi:hypothetical protein
MLSVSTERVLGNLLFQVGEGERRVETVRQALAEQPDFDPYSAFNRIDKFGNGFVSLSDLSDFLRVSNVFPDEGDLR